LSRRIATRKEVGQQARIWKNYRNRSHIGIDWQFTTDNARIKLRHLVCRLRFRAIRAGFGLSSIQFLAFAALC
jgi:hypothetical protein